uniref:Protocadherin 2 alpha a 15 n=1 Tax=Oryzias melastigma TaxID=30732 RepID=A0A3B3D2C6_ORYME
VPQNLLIVLYMKLIFISLCFFNYPKFSNVNDNMPVFTKDTYTAVLQENSPIGTTVIQVNATDLDDGINGEVTYSFGGEVKDTIRELFEINSDTGEIIVKENVDYELQDRYDIDIQASDKGIIPLRTYKMASLSSSVSEDSRPGTTVALLKTSVYDITIIAKDGGEPALTSEKTISVYVSDTNDNKPEFLQNPYTFYLTENNPPGGPVLTVQATDRDDGENAHILYHLLRIGEIDFEESGRYEINVQASDKGAATQAAEKTVIIDILDINDNAPVIEVTSFSRALPEDSKPGTTVALISVRDSDSGINGKVLCFINQNLPFTINPSSQNNMYSLVTKQVLDREQQTQYEVMITAKDAGEPSLSSEKSITVVVSDVNDNVPTFSQNPINFYIKENNSPGKTILSVTAHDSDDGSNALISYSILREKDGDNLFTSFLNVNSESGEVVALKSFDFESVKTFQFHVVATDSGSPPLSSNVTVNVFILDQNDNAPVILYPVSSNGSAEGVEEIPRNVNAGHLVTKVRAYDADIGYNGWLLFSLQQVTDHSLFALDRYTGQIRTLRSFTETDEAEHKLLILVKDNGNVSLSATATVIVKLVEPKEAFAASDVQSAAAEDEDSHVTFYLIITLGSVSLLFLISIIVLIAMQCSKSTDYTSKYLPEPNYDGTLCHSIQYRSGDKRYMLVGPRMSVGSTIVPGSHANTLVLPDRRKTSDEVW